MAPRHYRIVGLFATAGIISANTKKTLNGFYLPAFEGVLFNIMNQLVPIS